MINMMDADVGNQRCGHQCCCKQPTVLSHRFVAVESFKQFSNDQWIGRDAEKIQKRQTTDFIKRAFVQVPERPQDRPFERGPFFENLCERETALRRILAGIQTKKMFIGNVLTFSD